MNKVLIYNNLSLSLYRLFDSKYFDFETLLDNGGFMSVKAFDNARLTKYLENSGVCASRSQALDLINHGVIS